MTDARPTLKQQVAAVELVFVNHNGYVEILRGLVAKGKRTPQELAMAENYLPALRQAVLTMRFIEINADRIRELTKGASGDAGTGREQHEPAAPVGGAAEEPDPY